MSKNKVQILAHLSISRNDRYRSGRDLGNKDLLTTHPLIAQFLRMVYFIHFMFHKIYLCNRINNNLYQMKKISLQISKPITYLLTDPYLADIQKYQIRNDRQNLE